MAWLNGQEPEEEDWKTKKSEEETFLWEWTRSVEILISQVHIHQKASNTEEALNKQEDRMIRPVDISQSFSLISWHNGCINGVAM